MAGRKQQIYDNASQGWISTNLLNPMAAKVNTIQKALIQGMQNAMASPFGNLFPSLASPFSNLQQQEEEKRRREEEEKRRKEELQRQSMEQPKPFGQDPEYDAKYNLNAIKKQTNGGQTPIYYPSTDEYWNFVNGKFTNQIPENVIGSIERRRIQGKSKSASEEWNSWVFDYYNKLRDPNAKIGVASKTKYNLKYGKTDEAITQNNLPYNNETLIRGRIMRTIAGDNFIDKYKEDLGLNQDSEKLSDDQKKHAKFLDELKQYTPVQLAQAATDNPQFKPMYDQMLNHFMLRYYGRAKQLYTKDPLTIYQDRDQHGEYKKVQNKFDEAHNRFQENLRKAQKQEFTNSDEGKSVYAAAKNAWKAFAKNNNFSPESIQEALPFGSLLSPQYLNALSKLARETAKKEKAIQQLPEDKQARAQGALEKQQKEFLADHWRFGKPFEGVIENILYGVGTFGNTLINKWGFNAKMSGFTPKDPLLDTSTDIENKQRDRVNENFEKISAIMAKDAAKASMGQDVTPAIKAFDEIADAVYGPYEKALKSTFSDSEKRDLMYQYTIHAQYAGPEEANNFLKKYLQERHYVKQGPYEIIGNTAKNLFNNVATTAGHILNMAVTIPQLMIDLLQTPIISITEGKNPFEVFMNESLDTIEGTLDNWWTNYLGDIEETGSWISDDLDLGILGNYGGQKYYKAKGYNANQIVRHYGHDEDAFGSNIFRGLAEILPVSGYMVGSVVGSGTLNNVNKFINFTGKNVARGVRALGLANNSSKMLAAANVADKWLAKGTTFLNAMSPTAATVGMDFGYAKTNYDSHIRQALQYVNSPEFEQIINDKINAEQKDAMAARGEDSNNFVYSSLQEKIELAKQDAEFMEQAKQHLNNHNAGLEEYENAWTIEDAIKDLITKPYKEDYLKEAQEDAVSSAALTWALTIIPDVHITNTWRKSMFSSTSRGAMKSIANSKFLKPLARGLGIKGTSVDPFIQSIKIVDKGGKKAIELEGKEMTRKDLTKMYLDQAKGGFLSNYLQDSGVAFGNSFQQSLLEQYIDNHFNEDALNTIDYNLTHAWATAFAGAANALGDTTSFRDGLYGALAPWILNARSAAEIKEGLSKAKGKGIMGKIGVATKELLVKPIFASGNAYKLVTAKKTLSKENERRRTAWVRMAKALNEDEGNLAAFMNNIGSIVHLTKKENQAVEAGDYNSFVNSRLGLLASNALLLSMINEHAPIRKFMEAYVANRAARKQLTDKDYQELVKIADTYKTLLAEKDEEKIKQFRNSIDAEQLSLIDDLISIQQLNEDAKTKDTRTEVQKINDLTQYTKDLLELTKSANKYLADAEATYGENADIITKQEYARLLVYRDALQQNVKEKKAQLQAMESKASFPEEPSNVNRGLSSEDLEAIAILQAKYKGSATQVDIAEERTRRELEDYERKVAEIEAQLRDIKRESKQKKNQTPEQQEDYRRALTVTNQVLGVLKYNAALHRQKLSEIKRIQKAIDRNTQEGTEEQKNAISHVFTAQEIAQLPEKTRLQLLEAAEEKQTKDGKKVESTMSEAQKKQVDIFNNVMNKEMADGTTYKDVLSSKLNNETILNNLVVSGKLTEDAIAQLNKKVAEVRTRAAAALYAKNYADFAEEDRYVVTDAEGINEQASYEKFMDALLAKTEEMDKELEGEELTYHQLGLQTALEGNKYYKKFQEKQREFTTAVNDLLRFIAQEKLDDSEREELINLYKYAILKKGASKEVAIDYLRNLADTDSSQLNDIYDYLVQQESAQVAVTPESKENAVKDLKDRIIQYTNLVRDIEKRRKEKEARTKDQEENPESKSSKEEKALKKFGEQLNTLQSYVEDRVPSHIKELLKKLNINIPTDLLDDDFISIGKVLNEIIGKALEDADIKTGKDVEGIADKIIESSGIDVASNRGATIYNMIFNILRSLSRKSQEIENLVPLETQSSGAKLNGLNGNEGGNQKGNGGQGNGEGGSNGGNSGGKGSAPTTITILTAAAFIRDGQPLGALGKILMESNIDEFLTTVPLDKAEVVFISSGALRSDVKGDMGERYADGINSPVLVAIALPADATAPTKGQRILVEGRQCQVIGVLPANDNTQAGDITAVSFIRSSDVAERRPADPKEWYFIKGPAVGEAKPQPITTTMDRNQITTRQRNDTPTMITWPSNSKHIAGFIIPYSNGEEVKEKGRPHELRHRPNLNDTALTLVKVQTLSESTNDEGVALKDITIEDADKIVHLNSRTQKFAEALENIIRDLPSLDDNNLNDIITTLRDLINKKFEDNNTPGKELAKSISLPSGYMYSISIDNGKYYLTINEAKNNGVPGNLAYGSRDQANYDIQLAWDLTLPEGASVETLAAQIIKDLSELTIENKVTKSDTPLGKWQVNYGSFIRENLKNDSHLQYVRTAVEDRILFSHDILPSTDGIKIDAPTPEEVQARVAIEGNEVLEQQARLDSLIDPETGESDVGVDLKALETLIRKNEKEGEDSALLKAILRLQKSLEGYVPTHSKDRSLLNTTIIYDQEDPLSASVTAAASKAMEVSYNRDPKQSACSMILGNVVDDAGRRFFAPNVNHEKLKEQFKKDYAFAFSNSDIEALWEGLLELEEYFKRNKMYVVASGIYTFNTESSNKRHWGELDLLVYNANTKLFQTIDIKTFKVEPTGSYNFDIANHLNYLVQVGVYTRDLSMAERGIRLPFSQGKGTQSPAAIFALPVMSDPKNFTLKKEDVHNQKGEKVGTKYTLERKDGKAIRVTHVDGKDYGIGRFQKAYISSEMMEANKDKIENAEAIRKQNANKKRVGEQIDTRTPLEIMGIKEEELAQIPINDGTPKPAIQEAIANALNQSVFRKENLTQIITSHADVDDTARAQLEQITQQFLNGELAPQQVLDLIDAMLIDTPPKDVGKEGQVKAEEESNSPKEEGVVDRTKEGRKESKNAPRITTEDDFDDSPPDYLNEIGCS